MCFNRPTRLPPRSVELRVEAPGPLEGAVFEVRVAGPEANTGADWLLLAARFHAAVSRSWAVGERIKVSSAWACCNALSIHAASPALPTCAAPLALP